MNICLAGFEHVVEINKFQPGFLKKHNNYLITYAHFARIKNQDKLHNTITEMMELCNSNPNKNMFMLDSGAFSKANGKVSFELEDYIKFLHKYESYFSCYVNLDVPLLKDQAFSEEYVQYSLEISEKNLASLEQEGLKPIPVYQRIWNRPDILEKYLERYEFICIGGVAGGIFIQPEVVTKYLDMVFNMNSKYKKKLHGLGQTQDRVLKKYPFYSVDSTSWLFAGALNKVFVSEQGEIGYKPETLNGISFKKLLLKPNFFDNFNSTMKGENDVFRNYAYRQIYNVAWYNDYQRIISELWNERNITWSEYEKNKHFSN